MLLCSQGLAPTRARAQALIVAGKVFCGQQRLDKPGHELDETTQLRVEEPEHPWVSRGGMKLAHALAHFGLNPEGRVCVDVGASTGGFTDVLLHHGARLVYAVDVGHGQLDWKLRSDARVKVMEKTNARYLTRADLPEPPDWVVCDASFISLRTVLPAALELAAPQAVLVALIKPQFEVGKGKVGKGGVVRDEALHRQVCDEISHWLGGLGGWSVVGITPSPLLGPKGNTEFLLAAVTST